MDKKLSESQNTDKSSEIVNSDSNLSDQQKSMLRTLAEEFQRKRIILKFKSDGEKQKGEAINCALEVIEKKNMHIEILSEKNRLLQSENEAFNDREKKVISEQEHKMKTIEQTSNFLNEQLLHENDLLNKKYEQLTNEHNRIIQGNKENGETIISLRRENNRLNENSEQLTNENKRLNEMKKNDETSKVQSGLISCHGGKQKVYLNPDVKKEELEQKKQIIQLERENEEIKKELIQTKLQYENASRDLSIAQTKLAENREDIDRLKNEIIKLNLAIETLNTATAESESGLP